MLKTGTIREALYSAITASPSDFTSASASRFRAPGNPIHVDDLPRAYLEFGEAEVEPQTMGATRTYDVTERWGIVVVTTSEATADSRLGNILSALDDRTLSGNVLDVAVAGVTYEQNSEGETDWIRATLSLQVYYTTTKAD